MSIYDALGEEFASAGFIEFPDAVSSAGAVNQKSIRIMPGSYSLTSNLTVPANINLKMPKGTVLTVPSGVTLTINGTVEAGLYQVFSCTGTGKVSFAATSPQVDFYPEWWGAVGDGATDDLAALNSMRDAVVYSTSKIRGVLHLGRWYAVSSTWSIDNLAIANNTNLTIQGTGKYTSGLVGTVDCSGKPVMEIVGTPNVYCRDFGLKGVQDVAANVYPAYAPSVGLLLGRSTVNANGYNSRFIDLGFWGYFQYGCMFNRGYSDSEFRNCQTYTSPLALANANNHWSFDFAFEHQNQTTSFSGLTPTNATFATLTTGAAENNKVYNCYFAGTNYASKAGAWNACIYAHGTWPYLRDCGLGGLFTYQYYGLNAAVDMHHVFGDGYGSSAGIYLASDSQASGWPSGCHVMANIEDYTHGSTGYVLQTDDNTQLYASRLYRLRGNNGFKVLIGTKGALNCRFDSNNTMTSFVCGGLFEGCTLDLPYTCADFQLNTPSQVYNNLIQDQRGGGDSTCLYLGGITNVRVGIPNLGSTIPSLLIGPYKITAAAAAPTSGSWTRGSIIINTGMTAGGSWGWGCVLPCTFGTLNSGATTGSITSGTATLTVSTVTGLAIGDFIDVVADGGGNAVSVGRIVNINSTTKVVTLAANATATATGTAVSFHNETTANAFKAMPNLGS